MSRPNHHLTNNPNRVSSQNTSHHANCTVEIHHRSPRITASSLEQTTGVYGHAYQDLTSGQDPYSSHHHHQRWYVEVYRLQRPNNSALYNVVNNPILDVVPLSSRNDNSTTISSKGYQKSVARSQSRPPFPAASPPSGISHGTAGQLTKANLKQHQRRESPANSLRRLKREDLRAGPYDAIGWVRCDGEVYAESERYDGYEGYEQYDMLADNEDQRSTLH